MVESSEDEESEREFQEERRLGGHTPRNPTNSRENEYDHMSDGQDDEVGVSTGSDHGVGVSLYVSRLCAAGHLAELQWLEAYLLDEARDRTVDGKG